MRVNAGGKKVRRHQWVLGLALAILAGNALAQPVQTHNALKLSWEQKKTDFPITNCESWEIFDLCQLKLARPEVFAGEYVLLLFDKAGNIIQYSFYKQFNDPTGTRAPEIFAQEKAQLLKQHEPVTLVEQISLYIDDYTPEIGFNNCLRNFSNCGRYHVVLYNADQTYTRLALNPSGRITLASHTRELSINYGAPFLYQFSRARLAFSDFPPEEFFQAQDKELATDFGLTWGMTINDLFNQGIAGCIYPTSGGAGECFEQEMPRGLSLAGRKNIIYKARMHEQEGLQEISYIVNILADPEGARAQTLFKELTTQLEKNYPEIVQKRQSKPARPIDFYGCLDSPGCEYYQEEYIRGEEKIKIKLARPAPVSAPESFLILSYHAPPGKNF